ncbi:hypothetical protein NW767_003693 [Fusarium falciforme]|nr:hypothetical protein NW767_003693 [Fusarium falciforme]
MRAWSWHLSIMAFTTMAVFLSARVVFDTALKPGPFGCSAGIGDAVLGMDLEMPFPASVEPISDWNTEHGFHHGTGSGFASPSHQILRDRHVRKSSRRSRHNKV